MCRPNLENSYKLLRPGDLNLLFLHKSPNIDIHLYLTSVINYPIRTLIEKERIERVSNSAMSASSTFPVKQALHETFNLPISVLKLQSIEESPIMPNKNRVDDPTLSKLMEVESDLATQEAQLFAQLETIREKRGSLQSVISIFSPDAAPASNSGTSTSQKSVSKQAEPDLEILTSAAQTAVVSPESNGSNGAAPAEKTKKARRPRATQAKAAAPRKGSRRGQDLQNYMRSEFGGSSLTQAVLTVLQSQKDEVVSIPEVIGSIFVYETPREMRSKASTRIANILSTGLKSNKWYRGKTGHYSLSKEAASADLAS
jgi:hypothetical protein